LTQTFVESCVDVEVAHLSIPGDSYLKLSTVEGGLYVILKLAPSKVTKDLLRGFS